MRDPESARFRNERIRILWTKSGQRMVVYCGEVNSRNGFGGMAGFAPVQVFLKGLPPEDRVDRTGDVYIFDNGPDADYYLKCLRPDTERREQDFEKVPLFLTPEQVDQQFPRISDREAPDG